MHIFCLDYTVSVSKSYPLRVQNKLTTSLLFVVSVAGDTSVIKKVVISHIIMIKSK